MHFDIKKSYDLYDHVSEGTTKELVSFIEETSGFPDFIKNAEESPDPSSQPDEVFALVVKQAGQKHRKFPLYTEADAWLSQQAFIKNAGELPIICRGKVANVIKQACSYYGVDVDPWVSKMAEQEIILQGYPGNVVDFDNEEISYLESDAMAKSAFENSYALPSEERFPLNTEREIKEAVQFFERNFEDIREESLEEEFASNIKKACEKKSLPVPKLVDEACGNAIKISSEHLKPFFSFRISQCDTAEKEKFERVKLAYMNILENCPFMKTYEIKEAIKEADELIGIRSYSNIPSPDNILEFAEDMEKNAEASSFLVESDYTYDSGDKDYLGATRSGNYEQVMIEKMASKVKENPNVFRGYFDDSLIKELQSDFKTAFQKMSRADKETVSKVYQETVGENDE